MTRQNYQLTEPTCRKLPAPPRSKNGKSNNTLYWDSQCDGLALRVTSTGIRRWVVSYHIHGTERRITLKNAFPRLSPTAARKEAIAIRTGADQGIDPLAIREEARKAPTVAEWGKEYLLWAKEDKRPASYAEDERHVRYINVFFSKSKKFRDISKKDIKHLHRKYKDQPRTANKILALLSHMFTLAREFELEGINHNPVFGVKRYKEHMRTRTLDTEEAKRFVRAIDAWISEIKTSLEDPPNKRTEHKLIRQLTELRLFQFLLLTGARVGETCRAKWTDIDFNHLHGALWTLPAHTTKTDNTLYLDLGSEAEALLKEWAKEPKRCKSDLVFPGPYEDKTLTYPRDTWNELKQRAKLEDFNIHDLRHTNATLLLDRKVPAYVIQQRLGHTSIRTTERYLNSKDRKPLQKAAEIMGDYFQAMKSDKEAEIVPLDKKAR